MIDANDIADRTVKEACLRFANKGWVPNLVIAIGQGDRFEGIPIDTIERDYQRKVIRRAVKKLNAIAVVHVSEAWLATETPGKESGLMPSQNPLRQEVIIVHVVCRDGTSAYRVTEICRGPVQTELKPLPQPDKAEEIYNRLLDDLFGSGMARA